MPDTQVDGSERAPWGSLSREQVIDAAVEQLAESGLERLTIRSVAGRLGVGPMSLYRHVRDKDDLLDEVVGRLLDAVWRPEVAGPEPDARAWLIEATDAFREFLVGQPAALESYLRHPAVSAAAVERMDAMVAVLRRISANETDALHGYAALQTYTIGFAALESSRTRASAKDGGGRSSSEAMVRARALDSYTTRESFRESIAYVIDGIEGRARTGGTSGRRRSAR